MKKLLVISLYDGSNEIEEIDENDTEMFEGMSKCETGEKVVWLGEEHMYVEL